MKVLVVALDAQIRSALVAQFNRRNRQHECVGLEWLATDEVEGTPPLIPDDIDVVVNAVSLESVEQGMNESLIDDLALLAQACSTAGAALIHLSNSQVFDGLADGRKRELDDIVPASAEGTLLGRMEELVQGLCPQHIILRIGPLFCGEGDNLLTRLLKDFETGKILSLSNIGKSCPMHTMDLARVVSAIIDQLSCGDLTWGTYHYASSDPASSYQFAETVLAVASQYTEAAGQSLALEHTDEEDSHWSRPLMNCEKIFHTFGIKQLPWRSFVVLAVKQVFGDKAVLP